MKCKQCQLCKYQNLIKEIARQSIIISHKDYNKRYCDYEYMVNTKWIISFIEENFRLK
jgi:hypothetical protein